MKKILVIYKSKYGATKKYVDMLKAELTCDILDISEFNMKSIEQYHFIIFAGGIYASGIRGLNILRKNYHCLKHKDIAIFCVGASPFDEKAFEEIKTHNLKDDLKSIPIFYGRGAWNESKMTFRDRTLSKILKKALSKKAPASYEPWEEALMCSIGQECDWTDKKYLTPLLAYITKNSKVNS